MRSRRKGANAELEVIDLLRAAGWTHAHRNFGSGSAGGGDIARGPQGCALEVKRTEAFRLRDAWRQVNEDAIPRGDMPVVLHRWNGGPWLAIVEADELLELLRMREMAA